MIIGLSSSRAHVLSQEFVQGEVKKEYIARCSGEFPAEEVVVDQPLHQQFDIKVSVVLFVFIVFRRFLSFRKPETRKPGNPLTRPKYSHGRSRT
ncbi:hypothetical protein EDB85DRAFT_1928176 [Lactarius pseudohatsudake]|nr:hypothetical protein EDB85DRAFT_1928176 [Lactarius pseudohatsudake]